MGKRVSVWLLPGRRRKPSGPGVCVGEGERRGLAQEAGRPEGGARPRMRGVPAHGELEVRAAAKAGVGRRDPGQLPGTPPERLSP